MVRCFAQIFLVGGLVVFVSLLEAAMPIMVPIFEPTNHFRNSTHLEGSLTGWKACMRDGRKDDPEKSRTYLEAFCSLAYALPQEVNLTVTNVTRHSDKICINEEAPFSRGFSATLTNHSDTVQVARVSVSAYLPQNNGAVLATDLPITLRPGQSRHQCLGIMETFETQADAATFDALSRKLQIRITDVYGMKKGDPAQVAAPSPFLLTRATAGDVRR